MGKSRKSDVQQSSDEKDETIDETSDKIKVSWEEKIKYLSPIASPLAPRRLTKKLYKLINKAKANNCLRKGLKEVQKYMKKGEKGIVILAGDVSPLDIISHIPVVCEEADIPYCYTPSKSDLGESYGSKRQACLLLVKEHKSYKDEFEECKSKIGEILITY